MLSSVPLAFVKTGKSFDVLEKGELSRTTERGVAQTSDSYTSRTQSCSADRSVRLLPPHAHAARS
jgi:hypothetical protein